MRKFSHLIIPIMVGFSTFVVGQYFFPPAPPPPTGQISCAFLLPPNAQPLRGPNSSIQISRLDFTGQLTNLYKHDGVLLWHVDGTATIADQTRVMDGVVFLNPDRTVKGLGLWQERPGQDGARLRIMTLNAKGGLDWNDADAYAYFESDSSKLAHPFRYKCKAAATAVSG